MKLENMEIFTQSIESIRFANSFDMVQFRIDNQDLIEEIDMLLRAIGTIPQGKNMITYLDLNIVEKEEVLKRLLIEKEEE